MVCPRVRVAAAVNYVTDVYLPVNPPSRIPSLRLVKFILAAGAYTRDVHKLATLVNNNKK